MLRQYFMGLRTVGQWKNLSELWISVTKSCQTPVEPKKMWNQPKREEEMSASWSEWMSRRLGFRSKPLNDDSDSDDSEPEDDGDEIDTEVLLMRKFFEKWASKAGVKSSTCDAADTSAIAVEWTQVVAPELEGRIKMVGGPP
jgi:5'-nucleotidase